MHSALNNPAELDALALQIVRDASARDDLAHVSDLERVIDPPPPFTPDDVEGWRERDGARRLRLWGAPGVPHSETASSKCTWAFIRLTRRGLIREHVSGMGFSMYSIAEGAR